MGAPEGQLSSRAEWPAARSGSLPGERWSQRRSLQHGRPSCHRVECGRRPYEPEGFARSPLHGQPSREDPGAILESGVPGRPHNDAGGKVRRREEDEGCRNPVSE